MKSLYFVILVSILGGFVSTVFRSEKLAKGAGIAIWILLVAAFIAVQQGILDSAGAVLLTVGLTAMAAFPIVAHEAVRKQAVWALPMLLVPLAGLGTITPLVDRNSVMLVVAALAATVAGLSMVLGAAVLRSPRGLMAVPVATLAAVTLLGFTRSPLATGFQLPLAGPDGPVYWELASVEGMPEGLRLLTTNTSEWFVGILAFFAGFELLLVFLVLLVRDEAKLKKAAHVFKGLPVAISLIGLFRPDSLALPDAQPYRDFTRLALQTRQVDPIMAESARFLQTDGLTLDRVGMRPDFVLLAFGALVLMFAGWKILKELPDAPLASRDLFARGVAFLWLGWFLTMFFQASLMGSLGLHAPGEWIHLGLVILSTSLLLLSWRHSTRIGSRFAAWSPGILVAAWVLFAAVAWSYRSILGFSVTLG